MENKKKIFFLTGTRADFGKLKPLAHSLDFEKFDIHFVITGMHMLRKFGYTKLDVLKLRNVTHHEIINQSTGDGHSVILAKTINYLSDLFQEEKPDLVVFHGDRVEALACAIVCATSNLLCAHVEGGEVSGTIDEVYRHCCTKLSSAHFTTSKNASERLKRLGEFDDRIFKIGSPEFDLHSSTELPSLEQVKQYYDIPFTDFGICIFHPVTTEIENMQDHSRKLFLGIKRSGKNFVIIYPNNDPGSDCIMNEVANMTGPKIRSIPSMRFEYFSVLMRNCKIFIGNSSAGVREVPFFGIPSINIGTRQKNRALSNSVINVDYEMLDTVSSKILQAWGSKFPINNDFGEGNSAEEFRKVIEAGEIFKLPMQKYFNDC